MKNIKHTKRNKGFEKDNFDYVRGNPTEDESSTMLFYDRQLEALLSEKAFKKAGYKVARAGHWNATILIISLKWNMSIF